jgi:putative Mn2+ efflux pump MntP
MGTFDILLIAVGLAMDCFAVSIASGIILKKFDWKPVLRMATMFGLFQGIMPVIGWCLGVWFKRYIESYDHWVSLVILTILGIKMIREGFASEKEEEKRGKSIHPTKWKSLLMLSVATSIDALATGIIFIPYSVKTFIEAIFVIALVSFLFAVTGNFIGSKFGKKFNFRIEVLGGLILIIIGLKIFIVHTF